MSHDRRASSNPPHRLPLFSLLRPAYLLRHQPLAASCLSFGSSSPLFSMLCSLFCQKQGVGIPCHSLRIKMRQKSPDPDFAERFSTVQLPADNTLRPCSTLVSRSAFGVPRSLGQSVRKKKCQLASTSAWTK